MKQRNYGKEFIVTLIGVAFLAIAIVGIAANYGATPAIIVIVFTIGVIFVIGGMVGDK